jgi:hypothetical protein
MVFNVNNNEVVLTEADNPKEACEGCCFNVTEGVCPTIKRGAWTALMCEMVLSKKGANHFKTLN